MSDTVPRRIRSGWWRAPLGSTLFPPAVLPKIEFIALLALVMLGDCANREATRASSATTLIILTFDCQTNSIDLFIVDFI
ncbi:hypothetical protein [Burkholderia sp. Tr-20390]|uniref:hypothetical protein n=1 Tax=Burkholderia sp. Tr-20390 TaxID=2703904 RepID=UPI00198004F0|nr:hypothetical protein [Burkholderia sp. Tr-20390]MBN3732947.1 hypothetical protein [Burkholderia sp. Tr-20390]